MPLMATFDGLGGRGPGEYAVFENPGVMHTAQQAETAGKLFWPTVRMGHFGGCCGLGEDPAAPATDRRLGWIIGTVTVGLALSVFVATILQRGSSR